MHGSKKLKLGWLFPFSGIFKNLKTDLQRGLEIALQKEGITIPLEIYPEFIQTGGLKDTEDAIKKLVLFEQVDLVMGVASSKVALGILPFVETQRIPVILMNLGADIPTRQLSSDYLFYNSLHLWKSEWVMGKWAQKKFGGEPSINMSVYEGGYGLYESFKTGTSVSGAQTLKLNIVKNITGTPDTAPLIEFIRQQHSGYAHALLSGKEGEQFLRLFRDQEMENKPVLTVNPFMVEDDLTRNIPYGLDLYNAITWSYAMDTPGNKSFTDLYTVTYQERPNAFSMLAYESGLALATALQGISAGIRTPGNAKEDLARALGQSRPSGPRGKISLSTRPLQTNLPVFIRKPLSDHSSGKTENRILEQQNGIEWDDPSLAVEQSYLTGWQNPYLCV
ncbi:ABC transporter substrate-binding protein [Flavitalea flava]